MHELGIAENIVKIAVDEAQSNSAVRIKSIRLVVGKLSSVDPEALAFSFQFVCRDTIAEGAVLEFERIEGLARCAECDTTWKIDESLFLCPACGKAGGTIIAGEELRIDSLEIE